MKKLITWLLTLSLVISLAACQGKAENPAQTGQKTEEPVASRKITVILQEDGQEFAKKELDVKDKETLLDVMKENFKIEADASGFITSIEDKAQDQKAEKYWLYTINDKSAEVGANQYEPLDKDIIVFNLGKLQ